MLCLITKQTQKPSQYTNLCNVRGVKILKLVLPWAVRAQNEKWWSKNFIFWVHFNINKRNTKMPRRWSVSWCEHEYCKGCILFDKQLIERPCNIINNILGSIGRESKCPDKHKIISDPWLRSNLFLFYYDLIILLDLEICWRANLVVSRSMNKQRQTHVKKCILRFNKQHLKLELNLSQMPISGAENSTM